MLAFWEARVQIDKFSLITCPQKLKIDKRDNEVLLFSGPARILSLLPKVGTLSKVYWKKWDVEYQEIITTCAFVMEQEWMILLLISVIISSK